MKVKPLENRILIKPLPREEMSAGGIHIPGGEKQYRARVVSLGHHINKDTFETFPITTISVGDIVIYLSALHGVAPVIVDGEEHLVLDVRDVIAKEID